ncbi:hypothetical protein, partial [Thermogutta sp.]|uniref:hypothetical protein n=1 Tax=Thermogutta sp. TaxID=1962930 RepID=UPI00321F7DD7
RWNAKTLAGLAFGGKTKPYGSLYLHQLAPLEERGGASKVWAFGSGQFESFRGEAGKITTVFMELLSVARSESRGQRR